jgi:hypothetical protein
MTSSLNSLSVGGGGFNELTFNTQFNSQTDRHQGVNPQKSVGAIPWIPRGTLVPLDHNRSNHLTGWREKNDMLRRYPVDNSRIVMTLKSQSAVRGAFESYVKAGKNKDQL